MKYAKLDIFGEISYECNRCKFFFTALILISVCVLITSCDAYNSFSGSPAQQAIQHYHGSALGGKYVGKFSSEEAAKSAAASAGYKAYIYYKTTGECYGFD